MSKPLELTVYPKRFIHSGFYRIGADGSWTAVRTEEWLIDGEWNRFPRTEDKRLTGAELAAEFWASHGEANAAMPGNRRLLFSRRATLARFATHTHFDEEQA